MSVENRTSTVEKAMEDLCACHKRLDDAVASRGEPHVQAAILERVAGSLRAVAGRLVDEAERLVAKPREF